MIDNDKIVAALNERAPQLECPMCHGKHFTIVDGYILFSLQEKTNRIALGPSRLVPSIQIVCTHCGFISSHALGILGLLPKENDRVSDSSENTNHED